MLGVDLQVDGDVHKLNNLWLAKAEFGKNFTTGEKEKRKESLAFMADFPQVLEQ